MTPSVKDLYATLEATWPPARRFSLGPWTLRDGAGGGKRVSAATAEGEVAAPDLDAMEAGQAELGQAPLVMVREGEGALDAMLEARGYQVVDPVVLYLAPSAALLAPLPRLSAFPHWPRLAVAEEIWAEGGIGPGRLAVMDRVQGPKAAILGRTQDSPSGAAFVAIHDRIAMLHALEVSERHRRKGTAINIMRAAAAWAQDNDAAWFSLVVTRRNTAARALYSSLGMQVVGDYHYRVK